MRCTNVTIADAPSLCIPSMDATGSFGCHYVSLADCPPAQPQECVGKECTKLKPNPYCKKKKQESKMFYNEDTGEYMEATETERTKNYLGSRLHTEYNTKDMDLRKTYYMDADADPATASELVKRIQDGKFILNEKTKDTFAYGSPNRYVEWRDPAHPADAGGYQTAGDKLRTALETAMDEIKVFPPEKGLETLKAFQAATFS